MCKSFVGAFVYSDTSVGVNVVSIAGEVLQDGADGTGFDIDLAVVHLCHDRCDVIRRCGSIQTDGAVIDKVVWVNGDIRHGCEVDIDAIAEQEIFTKFDELRTGRTAIFVSHRLSSATIADKIIVLEYGEVVEMGNHHELIALDGKYAELFNTQAKRYVEEEEEKKA